MQSAVQYTRLKCNLGSTWSANLSGWPLFSTACSGSGLNQHNRPYWIPSAHRVYVTKAPPTTSIRVHINRFRLSSTWLMYLCITGHKALVSSLHIHCKMLVKFRWNHRHTTKDKLHTLSHRERRYFAWPGLRRSDVVLGTTTTANQITTLCSHHGNKLAGVRRLIQLNVYTSPKIPHSLATSWKNKIATAILELDTSQAKAGAFVAKVLHTGDPLGNLRCNVAVETYYFSDWRIRCKILEPLTIGRNPRQHFIS